MGFSTFGTFAAPYTGGTSNVWTAKIVNWISNACSSAKITTSKGVTTTYIPSSSGVNSFKCTNANTGTSYDMKTSAYISGTQLFNLPQLYNEYVQNIVSHEVSHTIHLASASGTVDHHYTTLSGVLMEQAITTKQTIDKSGNVVVTLYISRSYTTDDQNPSEFWLVAH